MIRTALLLKHRTFRKNNTHPKNPAKDPELRPIWRRMKVEMDTKREERTLQLKVLGFQEKLLRQRYMDEVLAARRAERDQQILDRHTLREGLQLRREAQFAAKLQRDRDAVELAEARERALEKQHQFRVNRSALAEYKRLSRDQVLLQQLDADSRHFVSLETLEAHIAAELEKFVGVEGAVNAFGMAVEREGPPPEVPLVPVPELSDRFREVEV
eukprot:EG_transcript_25741